MTKKKRRKMKFPRNIESNSRRHKVYENRLPIYYYTSDDNIYFHSICLKSDKRVYITLTVLSRLMVDSSENGRYQEL